MDVLTEQEVRVEAAARTSRAPVFTAAAVYAVVVGAAVAHHEPWADEAQSWLLARDAGLFDLWTRLLHYEGTTGLWHTLLHFLTVAGLPYLAMNIFSGLLGLAGICVLIWRAPFHPVLRVALSFTFYLCYQYAVIARSYDLLPLLLFSCAATYLSAVDTPWKITALLCLLASVSVHGALLAVSIGVSAYLRTGRRLLAPLVLFAAVALLLAFSAWPAHDGTFFAGLNLSIGHFFQVSAKAFANAFTGELISSFLVMALSLPLLWRGGGWLVFALSAALLCAVDSVIYSQVWHYGVLWLAWLFAMWISWPPRAERGNISYRLAVASIAIVAAVQCYWTTRSISYDWGIAYSGSRQAAQELRAMKMQGKKIYAIGYACTAIQPYFAHNIFANINDGRPEAYWDWSRHNHVNHDVRYLTQSRPDYVIVGYKNETERGIWTGLVRDSGYQAFRHFEGNSFWQSGVFEPESYDLFTRNVLSRSTGP